MVKSVLISGGLGQLGYFLCHELRIRYDIFVLDNFSNNKFDYLPGVEVITGSVHDPSIYSSLPDVDYIIHSAAQISVRRSIEDPIFDANNNILGTLNILNYARRCNVSKFVYISSAATYGSPVSLPISESHPRNPMSPYGLTKLTGERYTLLYGDLYDLPVSVVIPFNIYSHLQNADDPYAGVIFKFLQAAKNDKPLTIYGTGEQTRDFVHASDVATGVRLAMEKPEAKGEVFNIASGRPISINDLASLIIKLSGKDLKIVHLPEIKGEIKHSYADIEHAKTRLGFEPSITLEVGLEQIMKAIN